MKRAVAVGACLLALLGAPMSAGAHTIEPGSSPILDDQWVFCKPGHPLHLAVHTAAGNSYAVWTYNYNPDLGFFMSKPELIIAGADPDHSLINPGLTISTTGSKNDEILLVYVYGVAHAHPLGDTYRLIGYPPETWCEGGGYGKY